jgi:sugar O-acyltransferase (sialic acid O-acetyltransferase NeuD family)
MGALPVLANDTELAHRAPLDALYLAGSGSFAVEVAEWARNAGWNVIGLIEILDGSRVGSVVGGLPVIEPSDPAREDVPTVVALGGSRSERWAHLDPRGWKAATVIHPTAHVSPSARLAPGCIVGPAAVIGAETVVGAHTLVSRGALVGHHSHVGEFVSVLPGANVGGHAGIGDRTVLGMSSTIVNDIEVGCDVTVAAGAVVLRGTRDGVRVQGVPASEYAR